MSQAWLVNRVYSKSRFTNCFVGHLAVSPLFDPETKDAISLGPGKVGKLGAVSILVDLQRRSFAVEAWLLQSRDNRQREMATKYREFRTYRHQASSVKPTERWSYIPPTCILRKKRRLQEMTRSLNSNSNYRCTQASSKAEKVIGYLWTWSYTNRALYGVARLMRVFKSTKYQIETVNHVKSWKLHCAWATSWGPNRYTSLALEAWPVAR